MIKSKLKNNNGQTLPFMCLTVLALVMFWMLVVNMGVMLRDRIIVQNAADCAAQTAACYRARALNLAGLYNSIVGSYIVYEGSKIVPPQGAWIPFCSPYYTYQLTKNLNRMISGIIRSYGGGWAYLKANEVAKKSGADGIKCLPIPGMYSLGLKVDKVKIRFWSTAMAYGLPVPAPPFFTKRINTWYYLKDKYGPRKNIAIAYKRPRSNFFPMGKNFFGITEIPEILAIAAARPYNAKGSMFPKKKTKWGWKVVFKWLQAVSGGWEAHLVPVGDISLIPGLPAIPTGKAIKH